MRLFITAMRKRIAYLEEVNRKIRASLDTVHSLEAFQQEMNIEHGVETICRQGLARILELIDFRVAGFFLFQEDLIDLVPYYVYPETLRKVIENHVRSSNKERDLRLGHEAVCSGYRSVLDG